MQARWYGIVFLWVTFSFSAVVQPNTVPQQDLPASFGEVLEEIERDGLELRDYLYPYHDGFPNYLVILLETVGFLLLGFGLIAEMIAQLREEVDSLRRGDR